MRRFLPILLVLSCAASAAPAATAGAARIAGTARVVVEGRVLEVPAPAGARIAPELETWYVDACRSLGGDLKAVFRPESLAAHGVAGRPAETGVALVLEYRGALAQTPAEARIRFVYGGNADQALRARSSDTVLYDRIRHVMHRDPEGQADVVLPSAPGENVGVATFRVDDRASAWLVATTRPLLPGARAAAGPTLRASATVIAGERVIGMVMAGAGRPTTGAVVRLRRRFEAWVRATLEANEARGQAGAGDSTRR